MSKTAVKKLHWRSKVQDSFVPLLGSSGELGIAVGGGADYGEFPFVTAAPGGGLTVGDIILEIGGTPVLGMTLGDVRGVLNSCPHPVRIKTVSPAHSKFSLLLGRTTVTDSGGRRWQRGGLLGGSLQGKHRQSGRLSE
ncbi:membrane-associated guanylate kinase, WW and PDZ domain-containing protein 3-like isoform X1 [Lates japonicus]|uniref:Membrane-associated guanylate kinase, WW and PDZ domain-containing protein 3-like isoform X1 n=1 Tax=Lates japonicus TaxID=270547 RepID=A0AAD3MQU6_LATJO|nr:membrane-associated guanylate kinase, WW and PDZ domain-containing protein 3-like isoform X1 [Lates japonicus]